MSLPPLFPEQARDADILYRRKKAGDFSEAGAAKTRTALEVVRKVGGRTLVTAPPIAVRMWGRVAQEHLELDREAVAVFTATSKPWKALRDPQTRFVVASNALAVKDPLHGKLMQWAAEVTILDEAHAYKTLESARTVHTYGRGARGGGLVSASDYVLALTGTPVLKYADDMFPHLKALRPDILAQHDMMSEAAFKKTFCVEVLRSYHPRQKPKMVVIDSKNEDFLNRIVYDAQNGFAVRRRVTDLSEMPPLLWTPQGVEFMDSPALREATAQVEDPEQEGGPVSRMRRLLGAAKAPHVAVFAQQLHEELVAREGSQPVLVLFWHTEVGHFIRDYLEQMGYRVGFVDGSSNGDKRGEFEDKLNSGSLDFGVGQIATMGVSLNLQERCNTAVVAEFDWSPGVMEQAVKRLWRTGQQRRVTAYMCAADHIGDDAALAVLARKEAKTERINRANSR